MLPVKGKKFSLKEKNLAYRYEPFYCNINLTEQNAFHPFDKPNYKIVTFLLSTISYMYYSCENKHKN